MMRVALDPIACSLSIYKDHLVHRPVHDLRRKQKFVFSMPGNDIISAMDLYRSGAAPFRKSIFSEDPENL